MVIRVGDKAKFSKLITEEDVLKYAELLGDTNSLHFDDNEAEKNIFGKSIAHGLLVGGLISTVIGTKLPGNGTIYLEQNFNFKKPVFINDLVTAEVEVAEIINEEKGIYRLLTIVKNQEGIIVIDGQAVVLYKS